MSSNAFTGMTIGIVMFALGVVALLLTVSNWRGRTTKARKRALRTTPQISTPGTAGFVVLPAAGISCLCVAGLACSAAAQRPFAALLFAVLAGCTGLVMMVMLAACGIAGRPIWAPGWYDQITDPTDRASIRSSLHPDS